MKTKNEIFKDKLKIYLKSNKKEKSKILDEICSFIGISRKGAIKKFKRLQLRSNDWKDKRGRKRIYGNDVIAGLKDVWEIGNEVCGELLYPVIPEYIEILQRDKMWKHSSEVTEKLLKMSEGSVKKYLSNFLKARRKRKGKSSTTPSKLKQIIPVETGNWKDKEPGFGQIDTVVHCGSSLLGDMVFSVNFIDISTLWNISVAQWNKGQRNTLESIKKIKDKLPWEMKGIHSDTGSEFINWHCYDWCKENDIYLSRSRPSHKNDNGFVEERNGHIVRKFLGYRRFDLIEEVEMINQIYHLINLYTNHFIANRKTLEKYKIGSKYKRKLDKAKTPFQRVLEHPKIPKNLKDNLIKEHKKLNPLTLKRKIDKLINELNDYQRKYGKKNF